MVSAFLLGLAVVAAASVLCVICLPAGVLAWIGIALALRLVLA